MPAGSSSPASACRRSTRRTNRCRSSCSNSGRVASKIFPGRCGVAQLLAEPAYRNTDEVGEQEAQIPVLIGRRPLALPLLFVEFQQEGEEQARIAAPEIEQRALRGAQGLIVLPLLQEPRAVAVDVDAPAEVALDQLLEGGPVLSQEEEKIGVVLAVKEGGLGKDVEDSPHALELEPVQPQLAGIRRLRRSPLVSHDGLRSGRS